MVYSADPQLEAAVQTALATYRELGIAVVFGPSGSGKSHLARWLHDAASPGEAFIEVAAASLEPNRLESVLFGHVKGAFTGAVQAQSGLLGAAGKGALCVDGLENLPLESQAKLLRLIQERRYRPVGGLTERVYEGGFLFTVGIPPRGLVDRGRLRDDLFFRIQGNSVGLPGCDGRLLDFELIAMSMVERFAADFPHAVVPSQGELSALAHAAGGSLAGNFHGVWNLLQRAAILGTSPAALLDKEQARQEHSAKNEHDSESLPATGSLKGDLAVVEKRLIERALLDHPESRQDLADALGISIRSLMYKLKAYGLS